ncbi:acyltransferase [Leptolyngbya sp. FACHB-541]|uniref:acyltransferase n=1 Tax=Leptolyngbya sp. FACHB-541 TaxID=2692810 RepID=UPI001687ACEB|nr:acyltransferase [Leptolyngbya sp. FACHB-541]MBD2001163.1 acyltransferase [Leptolyngbya sp. FACHB-541]
MSTEKSQPRSTWLSRKGATITALVGWIPLSQGLAIRRFLYSKILGKLGKSVYIEPGAEFLNTPAIAIGNGVKILRGVRLDGQGQDSQICIGDNVQFAYGIGVKVSRDNCRIEIGDRTSIGPYTVIHGPGNISIGKDCLIAAHCGIYASNHQFADGDRKIRDQGLSRKGIVIEDDCWIGHSVSILDGVTVGQGSVIGAGAVVTKDIPPYSIAVGVPARVISQRRSNDPVEELKEALAQAPQS